MLADELENLKEVQDIVNMMSNMAAALSQDGVKVLTPIQYEQTADMLKNVKSLQKMSETARKGLVGPHLEAQRAINGFFQEKFTDKLQAAENRLKGVLVEYEEVQERKAREAQAAADEKARKEAERLEKRARAASEKGQHEKADELAERAQGVVAPISMPAIPKAKGVSTRTVWDFEITNTELLPRTYLKPDEAKIRKVVQALKDDTDIPGVKVTSHKSKSATG